MTDKIVQTFDNGMKSDFDNHIKMKNTYVFGLNARLFEKNGTLSLTTVKGTEEVLNDSRIVKYLGAVSFKDQLIVFVKASGVDINVGGTIYNSVNNTTPTINNFNLTLSNGEYNVVSEISDNSSIITYTEQISYELPESEVVINDNYDPSSTTTTSGGLGTIGVGVLNLGTYFKFNVNVPNFAACEIQADSIPLNNKKYSDCIFSISKDSEGNFVSKILWAGYQNWSIDAKIVALGVDENSNYRRVKYTDFQTTFKSINVYDPDLYKRSASELENFQTTALLQPRVDSISNNGQLKSMAVQYLYRLITENGQVTNFSPFSEVTYIRPDHSTSFAGGSEGQLTNKSIKVVCNIIDPSGFLEIECVALEFLSGTIPTAIKSLGIKAVSNIVEFDHYGNESDLSTDITASDTVQNVANWKYCSDLETKNNKLFAFGLRNDPLTNDYNDLKKNFALHAWNSYGRTFSSFINPDPKEYNKISPKYSGDLFYSSKRVFSLIRSFGSTTVTLRNKKNNQSISFVVESQGNIYKDITEEVALRLSDNYKHNPSFNTYFPGLTIKYLSNVILLKDVDNASQNDMGNYVLEFSNTQVLIEIDDESVFFTNNLSSSVSTDFVHGAVSAGFNKGTGVRITYRLVDDLLMTKATSKYKGSDSVLNMEDPSLKKSFMKDEIYRLSIQLYEKGEAIFAIPLGDMHIPKIGSLYSYIDDNGNAVMTSDKYVNQKVIGNKLYGTRVEMHIETRLNCEFSKRFDMYQIMYVERDESNRSILCQGVSAPLMRVQDPEHFYSYDVNEKLQRTWTLPYHGGPIFDKEGFDEYDSFGEDYDKDNYDHLKRVINNRKLFYFDAPDVIYGKVSESFIATSQVQVLGRLNTDHDKYSIMTSGREYPDAFQTPKFSTKINLEQLNTIPEASEFPEWADDEHETFQTHFTNVSVFSEFTKLSGSHLIRKSLALERGLVVPGSDFGTNFEISNNAFVLPSMPWWYSNEVRKIRKADDQHGFEAYTRGASISTGERSVFIKTETDLFTNNFLGPAQAVEFDTEIRRGGSSYNYYDAMALVNIYRNNEASLYGGRSEQAYSKNTFIPLSETIPIVTTTNGSQSFNVEGDTYVTLWPRTKNSKGDEEEKLIDRSLNNGRKDNNASAGDLNNNVFKLNNAWCYAVVVETIIEPKLNSDYEFYRETSGIDFSIVKSETLNDAYTRTNNYKKYIPKPYRFKDDPNMDNIVAASKTKLSGEYYDAWSDFPVNEFQELDKNKGTVLNAAKIKDELYAIQERQTSLLYVDRNVMIPSSEGGTIDVKQGSGTTIDGYKVSSSYGTSIRRSLSKHPDFGFMFIDDVKKVIVKNLEELTLKNQYHHDFYNKLDTEKIVDVNGFFDEEFKETSLNIVTETSNGIITYNEALALFSGWREMNASIYMPFDGKIYIPREKNILVDGESRISSDSLHELNKGLYLNVLDKNLKMKVSFICSPNADETFIFPHIAWVMNNKEAFESITATTKEGLVRQLLPSHKRYKLREGKHSIPTLNYFKTGDDNDEKIDIRSEWVLFEFVFPYNKGLLRRLNRVINYIRLSYQ